ncbi:MAG TPA: FecR domain-containing protein [Asticcacaulis sp.]|nr:FecR domain-containing protein [Asticcacaulis sp.]
MAVFEHDDGPETTDIEAMAALWVVRAQGDAFGENDIIALTEWLEADDAHAEAYRRAVALWSGFDLPETAVAPAEPSVDIPVVVRLADRKPHVMARPPAWAWGVGGAVAAGLAAALFLPQLAAKPDPIAVYQTVKGQRQTIALADGSELKLNTDTQVSVQIGKAGRKLTLDHGEVALKVVHDEKRPFTLDSGDVRLTDIGTEFNVLRGDADTRVTVREGSVMLKPIAAADIQPVVLRSGDLGVHRDGHFASTVNKVNADEAFAWQTAHAVYRNQPLSVVVKDLNRYFAIPITVDNDAGQMRLNAVLTLDSESSVVGRLQEFLPLDVKTTDKGIVLSRGSGRLR